MSTLVRINENELLKGYCERLYMINPYFTMGVLFEELFGERVLRIHPYVPSHINRIVRGLDGYFKPEELIEHHTLYSFYTAFQGQEVQEDIKQKMLIDNGNAYKITKYNEIPIPQYYRYCPLCLKEQLEQQGDFSWNRIHQIAPVCTKHHVWIEESLFPLKYRLDHYIEYWIRLDLEKMCETQRDKNVDNKVTDKAIQISNLIEKLILGNYKRHITLDDLRSAYHYKLQEKGLVYPSGESIRITELTREVEKYFTKELLRRLGVDIEKCVTKTVNRFSDIIHPLYHVIMIMFLQIDIDKELEIDTSPILDIPVYCLNPLNSHEDNHIIDDIKVRYCYIAKQQMCTFSCSCGFVFTTRKDEVIRSNGRKIGNIKEYGKDYEENLLKLRHLGIKGIARKTGMNHGTIRKQLRCFDQYGTIIKPVKAIGATEAISEVEGTRATDAFKIEEDMIVAIQEIAATTIETKDYIKKEWEQKDQKYYQFVQDAIQRELEMDERPIRITRTRLAKNIGAVHAVVYNIDKMPQTKALIKQYEETQEQYYRRKIQWAIKKLEDRGEMVLEWKVLQVLGGCNDTRELIKQLIKEAI